MKITEERVMMLLSSFKDEAKKAIVIKKYDYCLEFLYAACHTCYTFYIGKCDIEIEDILKNLSKHLTSTLNISEKFVSIQNRVVLYDTFSQDSQGLTIQYLDAIIAGGYELLYITEFGLDDPRSKTVKKILQGYSKVIVEHIPHELVGMTKAQFICDKIFAFSPSRLFIHIHPSAVVPVTAFNALPKEIIRYQINLTDHAFWIGAGCTDYSLEFRDYGANLSVQYRNIPQDRILMLPYYPMMKDTPFNGFPEGVGDKVKIFAGASFYKIIDESDTFFKLNKAILDANPEAVTLFAGGGDMEMLNGYIRKYDLEGKFIPIGQRNDIFQCYKHSDIYLSTFPLFGGLMGQFAAHASLPILALEKKTGGAVEEVVCQKRHEQITLPEIEDVVKEATHLIKDEVYRRERGKAMKECVIDKAEFNDSFVKTMKTNQTQYSFEYEPDMKLHHLNIADKLKLMNKNKDYHMFLFNIFGLQLLFTHPSIWIDGFWARLKNSRFGGVLK